MKQLKRAVKRLNEFIEKEKLRPLADVAIFVIILFSFHFIWKLSIKSIYPMDFYQSSSLFMKEIVFSQSIWFIDHILGYEFEVINLTMYFPGNRYIAITDGCSGLKLFYQWMVLLVLYPGPWKHKSWFIPLGLIIVHLTNLFRVIALAVIIMWKPEYWDFSHDYILRPFFYFIMFLMWMFWEEKFRLPVLKRKHKTNQIA